MFTRTDQREASAAGDIVAGNKSIYNQLPASARGMERLMERLEQEIKDKTHTSDIIPSLQFFYQQKAADGIVGLEAKLKKAGRADELLYAYEKKELFAKLLEQYSLYSTAQRILAHVLAAAEHHFNVNVYPKIQNSTSCEIDQLITCQIIDPVVAECGFGPLDINHNVAMGMIYWLGEQCFIRWHQ